MIHHRDEISGAFPPPVDLHVHIGRGERQPVLDQLGKQVGDFGHHRAGDEGFVQPPQHNPAVILHFGQCGTNDVHHRQWFRPSSRARLADQDKEALGVAAHPGRQVVELKEVRQRGGVKFVAFKLADQAQLSTHEVLATTAQVG